MTPQQSPEGKTLEALIKSGAIKHTEIPGVTLMYRNLGGNRNASAQVLQELQNNREKYFVKSDEEQQIAAWKAKQMMEQQAEQDKQAKQQEISKQIGETLTQQLLGQAQGINQAIQGSPSLAPFLTGGGAGIPNQAPMPQDYYLNRLPQPEQNQLAMYLGGKGSIDYGDVVKNFPTLLQTPKPLTPSEQLTAIEVEAKRGLTPGSREYKQEFLTKSTPTEQQRIMNKQRREEFTYQQQKDKEDRTIEEKKRKTQAKDVSEYIKRLAIPTQDKVNEIKREFADLKTKTKMDYDVLIENKKDLAARFQGDPELYEKYNREIETLKTEKKNAIEEFKTMEKEQIESTRNVAYGVGEYSGLAGSPLLELIKPSPEDELDKILGIK